MTPPAIEFLGVSVLPWTMEQTLDHIERRLDSGRFTRHAAVHVAKLVNMRSDPQLRSDVAACDLITVDGAGVSLGLRLAGRTVPQRVTGIDLFGALMALAARRAEPVFLLGARQDVVEAAGQQLEAQHPGLHIAGTHHGYFGDDEAAVREAICASGATMLFVGTRSPLKERLVASVGPELGLSFAMGVGGAFDIVAGLRARAPRWIQRVGLEWAYRMAQEPRRLGPRYATTNTVYGALLARELAQSALRARK